MKKIILCCALLSLSLLGCDKEEVSPSAPSQNAFGQNQGQRILSEISAGESSVLFLANGDHIAILAKHRPGEASLLTKEMEGLTLSEIHQRLAPEKPVPSELALSKERFEVENLNAPSEKNVMSEGRHLETTIAESAERTRDLNDQWFSNNYCQFESFYNGYKACLLNRTPERGLAVDWAWANCSRSRVYVYPYKGGQIHLQGKIDGNALFNVDLLAGYVYTYYMYSGTNIFGCRVNKQHYYTITQTAGDGWHWSLRSNTDC